MVNAGEKGKQRPFHPLRSKLSQKEVRILVIKSGVP